MNESKIIPGIIEFLPEEITLKTKSIHSRLVETCILTYFQTQIIEMADTKKFQSHLNEILLANLNINNIKVICELIGEEFIDILVDIDNKITKCKINLLKAEFFFS